MFGVHIDLFSFHKSVAFCSNEVNFKEKTMQRLPLLF